MNMSSVSSMRLVGANCIKELVIVSLAALASFATAADDQENDASYGLSFIGGGWSKHLRDQWEPGDGYNEFHESIGFQVEQVGDGWKAGALGFTFLDSYEERSNLLVGTYGYRRSFENEFEVFGGLGLGYVETSYYHGAIALPIVELGYKRAAMQFSYMPEVDGGDPVAAVQLKVKLFKW